MLPLDASVGRFFLAISDANYSTFPFNTPNSIVMPVARRTFLPGSTCFCLPLAIVADHGRVERFLSPSMSGFCGCAATSATAPSGSVVSSPATSEAVSREPSTNGIRRPRMQS